MATTLRASAAAVASAGVITGTMLAAPDSRAARAPAAPPAHPVYFQNVGNAQNLEPSQGAAQPHTPVITVTPDGTWAQRWVLQKQPDGSFLIVSQLANRNLCVNAGAATGDIRLQTCTGSRSQKWKYRPDRGAVRFQSRMYQARYLSSATADGPATLAPGDPDDRDQQCRLPA
jgi:hypothetical protein